jgi:CubicO group peptidase (beta-lactamase class C family)
MGALFMIVRRKYLVHLVAVFAVILTLLLGLVPTLAQAEAEIFNDPQGRFTIPVPANWSASANEDGAVVLTDPDGKITIYALVIEGSDVKEAIADGWVQVAPDVSFVPQQSLEPPSANGIEKTLVDTQVAQETNRVYQGIGQLVEGKVYLLLIDADLVAASQRGAQLQIIATGFTIAALTKTDLSDATPKTIDATIISELEAYITANLEKLKVPGAAVAIVQDGSIVYEKAFGVRELGKDEPLTTDTQMMIGSTGKSLTTLMMATLVDDGKMKWDQKVVDILPAFAVKDPAITRQITVRNLVCACTGVPRRDLEFILNANQLTAEDMVESLKTFEFFTDFGEAFQYSNQMVATGGYVAALAAGGEYGALYDAYIAAMQERVFDPIGMKNTTFSFDEVVADANYATPHGAVLTGDYIRLSLDVEKTLIPVTPAGAHWSTAHDMALYMMTEINKGVTADGERVVSEANLLETWKPQVQVSAETRYGLGWLIDQYKGVPLIHHGGNTLGFTSEFAFLPDAGLGIVVMTNGQASNLFNKAILVRLLELVYDQPMEYDASIDFAIQQVEEAVAKAQKQFRELDEEAVQPYLGAFQSDVLGEMVIALADGKLTMDVGEFVTELRKTMTDTGGVRYTMIEPPLVGNMLEFKMDASSNPVIVIDIVTDTYTFAKVD